jgi:hypothetical protein
MAEVKTSNDTFAQALWHFGRYMPATRKVQIVLDLKQERARQGVSMLSAQEFLAGLKLL